MTSRVAILLSGQGGQHRDMFRLLADRPEAAPIFDAASGPLGADPRIFVRDAEEAALFANRAGQILCCTQALAGWATLSDVLPQGTILAGYSVGELAAWGCAGYLPPPEILRLAALRAALMDRAAPDGSGLAGIAGVPPARLDPLLARHGVELAIDNGPDSVVVGGADVALEACLAEALSLGARTAVRLRVAVPSHTSLLRAASTGFATALGAVALARPAPGLRLLRGLDAETVRDPQAGLEALAAQISRTIDWAGCLQACCEAGATAFLELGPGGALARMVDGLPARSLEQFRSVDGVRDWLARTP